MAVGSGSKGKETVSTVDGETPSVKVSEEKPVQAEDEWWSSDSDARDLVEDEDEDEDEDEEDADENEEDEDVLARWANDFGPVAELGNGGVILVLFETLSGFAIFSYDGVKLFQKDALQNIWADFINDYAAHNAVVLKEFRNIEDKEHAINQCTGINKALYEMIQKHMEPDMTLAVASEKYKKIIENYMQISCICPPHVEELIWGFKIQMRSLVTAEKSVFFPNDNQLPMCSGMIKFLNELGYEVRQEMKVSRHIIETAGVIYECHRCVNRHSDSLCDAAQHLEDISKFETASWSLLKVATALKMLCFPEEKVLYPKGLFSSQELQRMKQDAPDYENKLLRMPCSVIYDDILWLHQQSLKFKGQLAPLIEQAKKSYEAEKACEGTNGHEISPDAKKIRPGINSTIIDELRDYDSMISSQFQKRQVPPSLVPFDAFERYTLISSHQHHCAKPGILSIDIHPLKDLVATGGIDKNAVLYDLFSQTMCTLTGHSKKITSLKFVNRGELFITGSADKTVRIWKDGKDGNYNFIDTLEDHSAAVKAVAVHGTQNYFVTVSKDNSWCFYDTSTLSCLTQVNGACGKEGYSSASFHPYGSILGTGTTDAFVKIWDVQTQSNVAKLEGHVGPVTSMSFSVNGYLIATAALDGVKLWDLRTFGNVKTISPYGSDTPTNTVEFDFSGSYLAIGGSDMRVYQVADVEDDWNDIKAVIGTGKVNSLKFGADAKYIAVGSMDRNLQIFGLQS